MCTFAFRMFRVVWRYGSLQQIDELLVATIVLFDVGRQRIVDDVLMQLRLQSWQIRPFALSNAVCLEFIQFQAVVVVVAAVIEEIDVRLNVWRIRFEFRIIDRSRCGRCHTVAASNAADAMMLETAAEFRFVLALPLLAVIVAMSARLQFVMLHQFVMSPMPFAIVVVAMCFRVACASSLCNRRNFGVNFCYSNNLTRCRWYWCEIRGRLGRVSVITFWPSTRGSKRQRIIITTLSWG